MPATSEKIDGKSFKEHETKLALGKALALVTVAVLASALLALPATAAPFVYIDLRVHTTSGVPSHTATVTHVGDVVTMDLYAYVLNTNGNTADDAPAIIQGSIMSTDSVVSPTYKLLGNISSASQQWASGVSGLSTLGTNGKSIDTDTDYDVGFKATGDQYWYMTAGTVTGPGQVTIPRDTFNGTDSATTEVIGGLNYTRFMLASGITFTVNDQTLTNQSTQVFFAGRAQNNQINVYSDNALKSLNGNNPAQVLAGDGTGIVGVTITSSVIPEPATVALLILGAVGMVARRRRAA